MKPTLNFVLALGILALLTFMMSIYWLSSLLTLAFTVSGLKWNYNKEMTGDFDERD